MATEDFRDHVCDLLDCATEVFGEDVQFSPKLGGSFSIRAIFDAPFVQVDPDTERVIASNQLSVGVKLKDFKVSPDKGDVFRIRNLEYRIIDIQEDGQGGAKILLHRRSSAPS